MAGGGARKMWRWLAGYCCGVCRGEGWENGRNGLSVHADLGIIVIENYNYNFNYVYVIKNCNSLLF